MKDKKYFKVGSQYYLQNIIKEDVVIGRNLANLKKECFLLCVDKVVFIDKCEVPSKFI